MKSLESEWNTYKLDSNQDENKKILSECLTEDILEIICIQKIKNLFVNIWNIFENVLFSSPLNVLGLISSRIEILHLWLQNSWLVGSCHIW